MTTLLRPEVSGLVKPSSSLNLYKSSFFSLLECVLGLDFFINVVENFESFVLDTRIAGNGRGLNPISQPKDSVRNGVLHCHSKYHRTLPSSFSSGPKIVIKQVPLVPQETIISEPRVFPAEQAQEEPWNPELNLNL